VHEAKPDADDAESAVREAEVLVDRAAESLRLDSLEKLKARRNAMKIRRDQYRQLYQRTLPMPAVLAVIGIIVAIVKPFGWGTWPLLGSMFIAYGATLILPIWNYRSRAHQIDADIQEIDYQIDLQEYPVDPRESRAEKTLRLNDIQLRRYYDLNLSQNAWVFSLGIFCILLGTVVIAATLYLVLRVAPSTETKVITAVVGSIGSILANFVAAIYLKMNTTATANLKSFHSRLVETQQLLLGNLLASRIENDTKRWDTLSKLAVYLARKHDG